jgi:hypothetical protein
MRPASRVLPVQRVAREAAGSDFLLGAFLARLKWTVTDAPKPAFSADGPINSASQARLGLYHIEDDRGIDKRVLAAALRPVQLTRERVGLVAVAANF